MVNDSVIIKLDSILDKISKYGISSLSEREIFFLGSFSSGDINSGKDEVFEDGLFKFECVDISYTPCSILIHGRLYVPDLKLDNDIVTGVLNGCIILSNDEVCLNFKNREWCVWDFCDNIELDLNLFINKIINEIDEKRGFRI